MKVVCNQLIMMNNLLAVLHCFDQMHESIYSSHFLLFVLFKEITFFGCLFVTFYELTFYFA